MHRGERHKRMDVTAAHQVTDVSYTQDILTIGFPVPRDFALAFLGDNPQSPATAAKSN